MPRKPLIRSALNPYHVYNRTLDKVFYEQQTMPEIWEYCSQLLYEVTLTRSAEIHAFVLMSNHFHLVLTSPEENLDDIMRDFQSKLGKRIVERNSRQKFRFAGPYQWKLIGSGRYYANALKYAYQNPVRAKLCTQCDEYPYSTLAIKMGESKSTIPLSPSELYEGAIPDGIEEYLQWVNTPLTTEELAETRKSCLGRMVGRTPHLGQDDLNES